MKGSDGTAYVRVDIQRFRNKTFIADRARGKLARDKARCYPVVEANTVVSLTKCIARTSLSLRVVTHHSSRIDGPFGKYVDVRTDASLGYYS